MFYLFHEIETFLFCGWQAGWVGEDGSSLFLANIINVASALSSSFQPTPALFLPHAYSPPPPPSLLPITFLSSSFTFEARSQPQSPPPSRRRGRALELAYPPSSANVTNTETPKMINSVLYKQILVCILSLSWSEQANIHGTILHFFNSVTEFNSAPLGIEALYKQYRMTMTQSVQLS